MPYLITSSRPSRNALSTAPDRIARSPKLLNNIVVAVILLFVTIQVVMVLTVHDVIFSLHNDDEDDDNDENNGSWTESFFHDSACSLSVHAFIINPIRKKSVEGTLKITELISPMTATKKNQDATGKNSTSLSPSLNLSDGTFVCFMALLNAFEDEIDESRMLKKLFRSCTLQTIFRHPELFASSAEQQATPFFENIFPSRCLDSTFWKETAKNSHVVDRECTGQCEALIRKEIEKSDRRWIRRERKRTNDEAANREEPASSPSIMRQAELINKFTGKRKWSNRENDSSWIMSEKHETKIFHPTTSTLHPISFGVPESLIVGKLYYDHHLHQHHHHHHSFHSFRSSSSARPASSHSLPLKLFDFMPLLPGPHPHHHGPYLLDTVQDEWLMRALYLRSYFAFTHNRGGWDSWRSLEILSAGSIPYFIDLKAAPPYAVPFLPKRRLTNVMDTVFFDEVGREIGFVDANNSDNISALHNHYYYREAETHVNFKNPGRIAIPLELRKKRHRSEKNDVAVGSGGVFDHFLTKYYAYSNELLDHTVNHLTTKQVAKYVLSYAAPELLSQRATTTKISKRKKVLIVSDFGYDYQTMTLLHGFIDLFTRDKHDDDEVTDEITFVGKDFSRSLFVEMKNSSSSFASLRDVERYRSSLYSSWYGNGFGYLFKIDDGVENKKKLPKVRFVTSTAANDEEIRAALAPSSSSSNFNFDLIIYSFNNLVEHVYQNLPNAQKEKLLLKSNSTEDPSWLSFFENNVLNAFNFKYYDLITKHSVVAFVDGSDAENDEVDEPYVSSKFAHFLTRNATKHYVSAVFVREMTKRHFS